MTFEDMLYSKKSIPQQEDYVKLVDDNYCASWDKSDYNYVRTLIKKINVGQKLVKRAVQIRDQNLYIESKYYVNKFTNKYFNILDRVASGDTKLVYDEDINKYIEPYQVSYKHDRVVKDGMELFAAIIVGESTDFLDNCASGSGTTPPTPDDTKLEAENARVNVNTDGFANATGSTIRYGGIFAPPFPTATISEIGMFNAERDGIMGIRAVFPSDQTIDHIQNEDFYTVFHSIYQKSV